MPLKTGVISPVAPKLLGKHSTRDIPRTVSRKRAELITPDNIEAKPVPDRIRLERRTAERTRIFRVYLDVPKKLFVFTVKKFSPRRAFNTRFHLQRDKPCKL